MDMSQQPSSGPERSALSLPQDPAHPYAFLVHSQSTLDCDLPPKVDNTALARQKRRRTSPEDHAILEAEYQKNSKPDKAARAEIVKMVSLEEKAVQIWFQNRRQNDRRKSRPLLPHELIPHLRNPPPGHFQTHYAFDHSPPAAAFLPAPEQSQSIHLATHPTDHSHPAQSPVEEHVPSRGSSIHDLLNPADDSTLPKLATSSTSSSQAPTSPLSGSEISNSFNASTQTTSQENAGLDEKTSKVDESSAQSKKRAFHDMDTVAIVSPSTSAAGSLASSQDKSSIVRLSMSLDGAVRVKTNDEETPSPPKQRLVAVIPEAKRRGGLQRSKSEVGLNQASSEGQKGQSRPQSGTFGRSRDARTWEFYCDSDTRDALAAQAERERSGSAVGAISLIRSQSKKSKENLRDPQRREVLTPKAGAGNLQRTSSGLGMKPKLARTQSSMGRLQQDKNDAIKSNQKSTQKSIAKHPRPSHRRSSSDDSDKENWAPGTRASNHPLRRTHTSTHSNPRDILMESGVPRPRVHSSQASGPKRARTMKRGIALHDDNVDQEDAPTLHSATEPTDQFDSDEIAAFMNNNRSSRDSSNEKEADLDCIQGLLSLSQGAWR